LTDESNLLEGAGELANRVLRHHFGSEARRLIQETGGASNHVFTAEHDKGLFVLRLSSEPGRLRAYEKECWAIERARAAGVPTPEVIDVGATVIPWPYMLMHRVPGQEATTHPRRPEILRALGMQAARINAIATTGFGDVFDWAPPEEPRNATWRDFLATELQLDRQLDVLARHEMLPAEQLSALRETLEALGDVPRQPRLNHGDLRLKNVMVDDEGAIVSVLDWEKCISGFAPEWELSLALHDLSVDEKEEFARGYELSPEELERHAPALKALNTINYAPFIERAAEANDVEQLERYRLRLSGALDLYAT
jgi:hygromycin-B 4-O-kinase